MCPAIVSDLWSYNSKSLDTQIIALHFDGYMKDNILQVPIIRADFDDELCWRHTPSGQRTTKSACKTFMQEQAVDASSSTHGLTGLERERDIVLQVWKHKNLPPRVNFFCLVTDPPGFGVRFASFSFLYSHY